MDAKNLAQLNVGHYELLGTGPRRYQYLGPVDNSQIELHFAIDKHVSEARDGRSRKYYLDLRHRRVATESQNRFLWCQDLFSTI